MPLGGGLRRAALVAASAVLGFLLVFGLAGLSGSAREGARALQTPAVTQLPLDFVENQGQWHRSIRFAARGSGWGAEFERRGIRLTRGRSAVTLAFEGADAETKVLGERKRAGIYNFFLGNDPSRWRTHVHAFGSVLYRGLYRGVDMRIREDERELEYDVLVAPRADLDQVVIRADGTARLALARDGSLVLGTRGVRLRQKPPLAWEVLPDGEKRFVESRFRLIGGQRYGFEVSGRDETLPLVVDPGLEWSTFLGGSGDETVAGLELAPDGSGDIVVAGQTWSPDFPHTSGRHAPSGGTPYVARLNATGSALVYSTFFGGTRNHLVNDVALDASGRPVVVGDTVSPDFPTTPGAYDRTGGHELQGEYDAFVIQFDATGSAIAFGTYLGGAPGPDQAWRASFDPAGSLIVSGYTNSTGFPTTAGAYDRSPNAQDVFVSRFNATGSELTYSTFLGGDGIEEAFDMAVDPQGFVNLTGKISQFPDQLQPFPTTPDAFDTTFNSGGYPGIDAYFARLKLDGGGVSDLTYSTFLGGTEYKEAGTGVAVDPNNPGLVTVAGWTYSGDFPTTPGALLRAHYLPVDSSTAWVARFSFPATGPPSLQWSTLFGAPGNQHADDVVVDASGAAVIVGATSATNPPTTDGAYDRTPAGADAYVARISADGSRIEYSTLLGGRDTDDIAQHLEYTGGRSVVVAGLTNSFDFPVTPGAFDTVYGTDGLPSDRSAPGSLTNDGFIARLTLEPLSTDGTPPPAPTLRGPPEGARYTAPTSVPLDWSDVDDPSGIEAYHVQVSPNPSFRDPRTISVTFYEAYKPTSVDLVPRSVSNTGLMYWRVRALDEAHNFGPWSAVRTFTVDAPTQPDTPILESPPNNSRFAPGNVTFAWKEAARAEYYELWIDSDAEFRSPVDYQIRAIKGLRYTVSITTEKKWWWRMKASNQSWTDSPWSTVWAFETKRGEAPPPVPPPAPPPPGETGGEATALAAITNEATGSNDIGLVGGGSGQLAVKLNGTAPAGGAVVSLASNNAAVTVPPSVIVPAGSRSATFTVTAKAGLHVPEYGIVSGEWGGAAQGAFARVSADDPWADLDMFDGFRVNRTSLLGGESVQATVKLIGTWTAGAGGRIVTLASTNPALASVPPSVTIPAGANSTSVTIATHPVEKPTKVTIFASRGYTGYVTLELLPPGAVTALTLNPTSIAGGTTSTGTVTVSSAAPAGGTVVTLSSHDTNAATVPPSLTVPAGATSATFTVTAKPVGANGTFAIISASAGGVTKTAALNIFEGGGGGGGGADTISVTRAEYELAKKTLRIEATSTSSSATLKVYVTSTDEVIGTLTNNGGGKYSGQFSWPANPSNVTVKTSLGGSATKAVTAK
jgi:hypothetical protein